ncbi:acylphosphatase, partial [Acidiphilium sp. JA12-A1]
MPALRIELGGRVQGVGFRPFVYRLARRHGVSGWVRNGLGTVEILAAADPAILDRFTAALLAEAPPTARPGLLGVTPVAEAVEPGFSIRDSAATEGARPAFPPDLAPCPDCLRELADRSDRRAGYPFINCTQCGPRYSLIRRLPYDRANTAMAGFPLCPACRAEYADPLNRRFHAEPVACPDCGPHCR